ncbi:helix-turn-helix domain-containing protein [uncultured Roseibium sp.]|uniref:helix-turn-helix transcriptional regulator n=1 Tax=uncultured Roseibium sp. TaxID=1936171 RepID=UPI00321761D6
MAARKLQSEEWGQAEQIGYLEPLLVSKGKSWKGLVQRFPLPRHASDLKGRKVEMSLMLEVFEYAAELIGDDAAMLDYYSDLPHGAIPTFDYVALCAPSLRAALQNWQRFIALRTNCYHMIFTEETGFGILTWDIPDRLGTRTQNMFAKIAWASSRIEHIVQDPDLHLTIELTVPPPRCTSRFQERYGNRLLFSQARDRILIPYRYLAAIPPKNEENLYGLVEATAMAEVEKILSLHDPINRIKAAVNEHFKSGDCKLGTVAKSLGMSQRSLQRHLETEGTSFRELTDTIRRTLASGYLRETNLTLQEIAFLLGFSELSSFSRAVKTWFGLSPSQYRRNR